MLEIATKTGERLQTDYVQVSLHGFNYQLNPVEGALGYDQIICSVSLTKNPWLY